MSFFEILLIGIGLSMDAFAVSVCKGLSLRKIKPSHALAVILVFTGVWFVTKSRSRQDMEDRGK